MRDCLFTCPSSCSKYSLLSRIDIKLLLRPMHQNKVIHRQRKHWGSVKVNWKQKRKCWKHSWGCLTLSSSRVPHTHNADWIQRWANNSVFEYIQIVRTEYIRKLNYSVLFKNRIIFVFVFGFNFQTECIRIHLRILFSDQIHSYSYHCIRCICLAFLLCVFSNVASKLLHQKIQNQTDCICVTFLQSGFSNVPSNYLPVRI